MLSLSQIFMFSTMGQAGRPSGTRKTDYNVPPYTLSPIWQQRHILDCKNCKRRNDGHTRGCPRIHAINENGQNSLLPYICTQICFPIRINSQTV